MDAVLTMPGFHPSSEDASSETTEVKLSGLDAWVSANSHPVVCCAACCVSKKGPVIRQEDYTISSGRRPLTSTVELPESPPGAGRLAAPVRDLQGPAARCRPQHSD